jgi:hypothetical protein
MKPPQQRQRRLKDQKRIPLSMRITPEARARLVAEAERSGKSITQLGETLIDQGLEREMMFGGRRPMVIFFALATIAQSMFGDDSWTRDHRKFARVRERWNKELDELTPVPEGGPLIGMGRDAIEMLKQKRGDSPAARGMLREIASSHASLLPPEIAAEFLAAADADYSNDPSEGDEDTRELGDQWERKIQQIKQGVVQ